MYGMLLWFEDALLLCDVRVTYFQTPTARSPKLWSLELQLASVILDGDDAFRLNDPWHASKTRFLL